MLRQWKDTSLLSDGRDFFTRSVSPGTRVYGEVLVEENGIEYRRWDPKRSKLAAYLVKGGDLFPFKPKSNVLYLGAASGTTPSHISDVCYRGQVFCVEFSPRSFRDLTLVCQKRPNMLPILADAHKPDSYSMLVTGADIIYMDISQRDQPEIFIKNLPLVRAGAPGFLMIKARSIDVNARPQNIYKDTAEKLKANGFIEGELLELDPLEKDHAALVGTKA